MRIQSGMVKANKRDILAIKTFLRHAEADMSYGGSGTYTDKTLDDNLDKKEYQLGLEGMEHIKFLLKGLCDKWN
jgi:hypothetical protein